MSMVDLVKSDSGTEFTIHFFMKHRLPVPFLSLRDTFSLITEFGVQNY